MHVPRAAKKATDMPAKPIKTEKERLADADVIIRQKLDRIRLLERENKQIKRDNDSAEAIREEIFKLSRLSPDPPKWALHQHDTKLPGVPMAIWSDFHWGEVVKKDQVGGANQFNLKIAAERLRRLVDTTIDLALHHMVKPEYPGFVLCLAGDMVGGEIHEELAWTNEKPVEECWCDLKGHLITAITTLADAFGKVQIKCVVGNHGRTTRKPPLKNIYIKSFDWLLYTSLEDHFRNDARIDWQIPHEADCNFTVLGHRFCLTHGDHLGVKGGDGIIGVLGPIARGAVKLGRSNSQIGRDFDTLLIGHYHTYIPRSDATPVLANGSLIGFNEYAHLALRVPYSRPCQALWFVHEKHGITASWPVYLDKDRRK
jgi:predicted phosphodiesterase